ncbi:hypothetical protein E4T38_09688 [Aureobasidium subglaciale]|nr:hypothetical protein E4T38_09688 [Aureobasidium subglaciale]KAI5213577.1 hypothetical protein E4T40_09630 [Aureobasidium subglaciale]KAI5215259.1 hypothetical protein E4T41_09668 [Aureobasidium subglaciale]KAI5253238.1 hypothetical protein E4T46_09645 [Aureobasidium subglaciale]
MTVQDSIELTHVPSTTKSAESLLVFFITGNPGLIEYYRTFLTLCFDSLRNRYSDYRIKVAGTSLRGFEVQDNGHRYRNNDNEIGPYDLEQQIKHIGQMLERAIESHADPSSSPKVVLIGHSVGSYILLEVLRRRKQSPNTQQISNNAKIIGGICLFPTVTHIAKSPSGRKFSLLFAMPYFYLIAGVVVRLLFSWIPFAALQTLVGLVTGFPAPAAEPTTAFIKSPNGVRQALYLAGHEMLTITTDIWDDELWGISEAQNSSSDTTKLCFYFGTDDHWVADEARDELIAARAASSEAGDQDKPTMEIDTHGIPHGFCIKHNDLIAERVDKYIEELMQTLAGLTVPVNAEAGRLELGWEEGPSEKLRSQSSGASNDMPMVLDNDSSSVASSTTLLASSVGRSPEDLRDDDDSLSGDHEELCDRGQEVLDDFEQMSEIIALVGVDLEAMENRMHTLSSYSDYEARLSLFERLRNRVSRMDTRLRDVETGVAALNKRAAELGVTVETFKTGADRMATLDLRLRTSKSRFLEGQRTYGQRTDKDHGIVPTQTRISTTGPIPPSIETPDLRFPGSWRPIYCCVNYKGIIHTRPVQYLTIMVATVLSAFV